MHERNALSSGVPLKDELQARLSRARKAGLVDCRVGVDVTNRSNTPDLLLVLNNVLRIRETGVRPTLSA
jgi:hypothetical protein